MIKARIIAGAAACVLAAPVPAAWIRRRKGLKVPGRMPPWPVWLWDAAAYLYSLYALRTGGRSRSVRHAREMEWADALHPGMRREGYVTRHMIRKVAAGYGVILLTAVCVNLYLMRDLSCEMPGFRLEREPAEGTARQVDVVAEIDDEDVPLSLRVNARAYTEKELAAKAAQAKDYLKSVVPGENADLLHVRTALYFPESVPDLPFTIEWQPEDYQLIRQDGSLGDLKEVKFPVQTRVTAVIRYREESEPVTFTVRITGIMRSYEEELAAQVRQAADEADKASGQEAYFTLPGSIDGRDVIWRYAEDRGVIWLMAVGAVMAALMIRLQDERVKQEVKRRSESVRYDYPGFVHQMVLLLGAGMTVRRTWDLMIEDHEKNRGRSGKDDYLYREMLYARRQMQAGIPETEAYMAFGERMPYPGYAGISRLLVQLIRTGSKGMRQMMMKEAQDAEKRRRDMARRLGETAGTKLLLPMMLLLSVVFAVIMLPAFLSM